MFGFRRMVKAKGRDRFVVSIGAGEREIVGSVCVDLAGIIADDTGDPILRRVFPVAHASDERVEREYRDLVHSDLVRTRCEHLTRVAETIGESEVDRQTIESWLIALNTVRLVLGTRLDVAEDVAPELDPDDPDLPAWALYEYLGALVSAIVDALMAAPE